MDTAALKKFAPAARTLLREQVSARLNQVLAEGSAARREAPNGVRELEGEITRTSRDQVVERVAYTWFNRFTALRFMDANGYTGTRVVSPADGQTRPEILAEAAAGVIGEEVPEAVAAQVRALLDNRTPSRDPQGEAYRLLLVAICNHWHGVMPFMFEKIADCTELLMPDDLLSANSLLARLRAVMTEDACQDVEIIGWLYQFYISEKKDEVFAGLKKNVKITAENIPAATQLFTPHWIVRYLVENSLGRLWLLNRPQSKLAGRMDYYIAQEQPETNFLCISRPEEIRICDPACGSGHMLTYAFHLLYAIYEEEGYEAAEIPELILAHNLYGIEIDDRAGALAAFALAMKAAAKLGRRRFMRMQVQPNICVLQNISFTPVEMQDVAAVVGRDMFTDDLRETLAQFEQAKNIGSLIVPKLTNVAEVADVITSKSFSNNLFLRDVHERVLSALKMAGFLKSKYHVVIANPPYMGGKGMNERLATFLKTEFNSGKSDLMTSFILRGIELTIFGGWFSVVTLDSWMFLSSSQKLREELLSDNSIDSMAHIGWNCFPDGHVYNRGVALCFTVGIAEKFGRFFNLADLSVATDKSTAFLENKNSENLNYVKSVKDFKKIPGNPIAYWVSEGIIQAFEEGVKLEAVAPTRKGMVTARNEIYVRGWSEVSINKSGLDLFENREDANTSNKTWFSYLKGGGFRKWYGNKFDVVNWKNDGYDLQTTRHPQEGRIWATNFNLDYIFKANVNWGAVTSAEFSARASFGGELFDAGGSACFPKSGKGGTILGLLNSRVTQSLLKALNPTLNFQAGNISNVPLAKKIDETRVQKLIHLAIKNSKKDWDSYEISWNFEKSPLLLSDYQSSSLSDTWSLLRKHWRLMTEETQQLEEKNNALFIDAYDLADELTSEVPLVEISLTCNPSYRYSGTKLEADREAMLLVDTMGEFMSYAVGCMFGRYSVDEPGLILANQGDGIPEFLAKVPNPSFAPDEDNVIPMLDGDWFPDDISERFRQFLRITFGEERLQENLAFIEDALGKDIRKYFTSDFFNDHVKRYKKRPIYWLFSSPKSTFSALIYMHRYRPDTVSIVLNDYLRELRNKLEAYRRGQEALSIRGDASQGQRTKALKEVEATGKQIAELDAYERDVLFPLALRRIEIDLDDGVKANYPKFGDALKPIKGFAEADD